MSPGRHHPQPLSSLTRDHIKAWKLLNKGRNSCYANSLVLSLLWSETVFKETSRSEMAHGIDISDSLEICLSVGSLILPI